jgi:Fic-DOC domain mobile mystery protein B
MAKFETPEGGTPIGDAEGLLLPETSTMADLSAAEAENILRAAGKHLRRRHNPRREWLTDDFLRTVHRDMFDGVWDWAGTYRRVELNIGVAPHLIREEIGKACTDARFWDSQTENPLPVLERAVRLHHRLAWIHPFRNGNGRHARLMADIYLNAHGHALPVWPSGDISRKGGARDAYLAALKEGDRENFTPLMDYTRLYLEKP